MKIIGIDPGLDGACAIVESGKVTDIYDIPTFEVSVGVAGSGGKRKRRRRIDSAGLIRFLQKHTDTDFVILEEVNARPGMHVVAMFTFGRTLGIIETAVMAAGIPMHYVPPHVWKKELRVTPDKDSSRMRAGDMFPEAWEWWERKKDHNRAEAALIAYYGGQKYGRSD